MRQTPLQKRQIKPLHPLLEYRRPQPQAALPGQHEAVAQQFFQAFLVGDGLAADDSSDTGLFHQRLEFGQVAEGSKEVVGLEIQL
ncbi:MAG: hypothetical protein AAB316_14555 [Bacteroidota bacterium]